MANINIPGFNLPPGILPDDTEEVKEPGLHELGFDNNIMHREKNEYVGRIYLGALKSMAVSSIVFSLEDYADQHVAIVQQYQNPEPYMIPLYSSWNATETMVFKNSNGWQARKLVVKKHNNGRVSERTYVDKPISQGRIAGMVSHMKKRLVKGFHMRLEKGGDWE